MAYKQPLAEIMQKENPTHLNCAWCPAQAFPDAGLTQACSAALIRYRCPANHFFFVLAEDTSFNFGHNKEQE